MAFCGLHPPARWAMLSRIRRRETVSLGSFGFARMERETVLAQMASRLGLIEQDEAQPLLERYHERRETLSSNGLPVSFEQFALQEQVWSITAVERLLTHFASAYFQCDSCGHPQRGQQFGPGPLLTCTMCGANELSLRAGTSAATSETLPSQRTTQDAATPSLSPEEAEKVQALVAEANEGRDLDDVQARLRELAETLGSSRELTAALDGVARRIHEKRLAEAERVFFWGRIPRARYLLKKARAWAPDDPRVKELEQRVERVRYMLFGTAGLLGVVVLVAVLGLLMRADPDELRDERLNAALEQEDLHQRVTALQEYLVAYPTDEQATEALAEAEEQLRVQALARALSGENREERRRALENHLARFPEDTEAKRRLDALNAQLKAGKVLARLEQDFDDIRALDAPGDRARAYENFLHEHEAELPPDLLDRTERELARANAATVRTRAESETAGLDPWQRHERLGTLMAELELRAGRGLERARQWLQQRLKEARDDITRELTRDAGRLDTASAAREFLQLLEHSEEAVPEVHTRFSDAVAEANRRIAEKERLVELQARVADVSAWYDAKALLSEAERFAEEVPRLSSELAALRDRLEPVYSQRPPEVPGFVPLRMERFEAGGAGHHVHVYRNERFAEVYALPPVPEEPSERLDAEAAFTRPAVEFVLLPPVGHEGPMVFDMGSPSSEEGRSDQETQHEVTLTQPFLIARTAVTQRVWGALASEVRGLPGEPASQRGDELPVESVTWHEAVRFCEHVNLRLPTEAEWEYAARAGAKTPFAFGETLPRELANTNTLRPYGDGAERESPRHELVEVASLPANAFGLYEVHGNVWEWCADWRAQLPSEAVTDPTGPEESLERVLRGGSYRYPPAQARSAARLGMSPASSGRDIGLRPVSEVPRAE